MATEDLEIKSMSQMSEALAQLDDDARARVLDWAAKRFGVPLSRSPRGSDTERDDLTGGLGERSQEGEFKVFADLYDAANPKQDTDRALVGGYWFQAVQGQPDFTGQQVNNALKDVGHGVSNITSALGSLQKHKPALVRQVAKSGRSRQARKKYKLTTAGVGTVRSMINAGTAKENAE